MDLISTVLLLVLVAFVAVAIIQCTITRDLRNECVARGNRWNGIVTFLLKEGGQTVLDCNWQYERSCGIGYDNKSYNYVTIPYGAEIEKIILHGATPGFLPMVKVGIKAHPYTIEEGQKGCILTMHPSLNKPTYNETWLQISSPFDGKTHIMIPMMWERGPILAEKIMV